MPAQERDCPPPTSAGKEIAPRHSGQHLIDEASNLLIRVGGHCCIPSAESGIAQRSDGATAKAFNCIDDGRFGRPAAGALSRAGFTALPAELAEVTLTAFGLTLL